MSKSRNETKYRKISSKAGTFSPHISQKVNERLSRYCEINNINKTRFVECACIERLDKLEKEMLHNMTKEELEKLILSKWGVEEI